MGIIRTSIILTSLASSPILYASECNDPAPLLDDVRYYQFGDTQIIGDADKRRLRAFAKEMSGNWRGTELIAQCKGHTLSPHKENQSYEVQAEISMQQNGVIRMEAESENRQTRTIKLNKLDLSPRIDYYQATGQKWHTLEFIDDSTLIYSEKFRVRGENNFTRLIHEIKRIAVEGDNTLTVDRKLYVNGFFVEQNGWTLAR